ncbi:MAG: hypothetical protein H0V70_01500 [Ktedonobacteraceae bacterium]|nr:hypothetical protein [Ktedonobacteraceae bacterium]
MGDLAWTHRGTFGFPLKALRLHAIALGSSGSGKTETLFRAAYGARKIYQQQVIYLDAKGETKREEEAGQDNAARFVATMQAAGAGNIHVFPALHYNGWHGTPAELKNRLLSIIDFSESAYYGDVATNVLDLALGAPTTPRSSTHFLANLQFNRLKSIYSNDPLQYRRVLALEKRLLRQVEMRYQVFFSAMAGQLDGTLNYANADAVYLRVRGFTLRNEAPRLGHFLISDFMHYIAERRRSGVQTLLIIDEFNALRMREETSILFEQVRSFGGNLMISAQGYAGLGPQEYAERILDACSTYILHACSDPGPVSKRAGKRFFLETSWSEDEEGTPRKHVRPKWDWRVPESSIIQQEEGQAFWIYRGHAQHVQTAMVPITSEHVASGWQEIHRQEEMQRRLLEVVESRPPMQQGQKQVNTATDVSKGQQSTPSLGTQQKPYSSSAKKKKDSTKEIQQPSQQSVSNSSSEPVQIIAPILNMDDDEPDRL